MQAAASRQTRPVTRGWWHARSLSLLISSSRKANRVPRCAAGLVVA